MTDVKVEQCDVDCAQDIIAVEFENNHAAYADSIAALVARHRQAAEKAQQERDAGIADKRRRILSEQFKAAKERKARTEARDYESMAIEAVHIATAIRSQGHE